MVVELRPPLGEDKGSALRRLVAEERLDVIAYAGDDRGDLPAFAAVTELGGHALVVHGPDIAPEVAAVAGTAFTSPEDFQAWLGTLADALDAPTG
jgi:trehalose 6-phosphate phosphatase